MNAKICIWICFLMVCFKSNGQGLKYETDNESYKFNVEISNMSLASISDITYQANIITGEYRHFSCGVNFRLEDELSSEDIYILLNEVTFFDVQLNYNLGAFNISMTLENLLGFNNSEFAIEPNLDQGLKPIESVYFSHEANFLISTSISYNF